MRECVAEYRIGSATVRMHGTPDRERLKTASERFMKQVIAARKKAAKAAMEAVNEHEHTG